MVDEKVRVYLVRGSMRRSLDWQKFQKYVLADSETLAVENTYSLIGSKHRLKRYQMKIESIKHITDPKAVSDPLIRQYLEK
ncbi:MAG: 50S ribosomal protein L18Ae [Thermoprotei archaeon]